MGLYIAEEIDSVVSKTRWKIICLLRTKVYYIVADIMIEYKAGVLSVLEYWTSAIYHAAVTHLSNIDALQEWLLRDIGITAK